MSTRMPFMRAEGGFTTPAAAVALLVVCALAFVCTRGITVGSRSGQIQYVADAGALAADNVVAEFVTAGRSSMPRRSPSRYSASPSTRSRPWQLSFPAPRAPQPKSRP